MTLRYKDVIKFILKHRKGKAFDGWSEAEIVNYVFNRAAQGLMLVAKQGKSVIGVVCAEQYAGNIIHVENILTIKPGVIKIFMEGFEKLFPGFKLEGYRHGKLKIYEDQKKFKKKLKLI